MNITDEQISKIFELAEMESKLEEGDITPEDLTAALIAIERKIYSFSAGVKIDSIEDKKVLIADDLELSIYQLSTVLKKIGITPVVTRHKEEAISELSKVHYDCFIVDLFMPDSSDGIELIKMAVNRRNDTGVYCKIIVISGTDDTSLVEHCYELGVDFYIQKDKNWHSKMLKYLSTSFQSDRNTAFTRFLINNNIVSYIIKKLSDKKIFDSILQNVNSAIYTGASNVLFDLKEITSFDTDNAYLFAEIYKICAENNGKFVLVNAHSCIREALAYAYLEDVIPLADSVEDGVKFFSCDEATR